MARKILKPSRETLQSMLDRDMNAYAIADALGYKDGGWSLIYRYCREYGLNPNGMPHKEMYAREFTPRQKSFVLGSLLGDGALTSGYFRAKHTIKQVEYVKWKHELLKDFVLSDTITEADFISFNGRTARYAAFSTVVHPYLKSLYPALYPGGRKTVSAEWLAQIDPFALAVWYLDDGSRNKCYGTLTLCTNCFSAAEHDLMQDWFLSQWSIPTVREPRRNGQFSLRINARHAPKFLDIVRSFVPSCMAYKLGE